MREMRESGTPWIGEMPSHWPLIRFKDKYKNVKEIARERAADYERLALTLNGVIKRPKDDSEGLQPKEFDTYQILRENDFVFKMIDLQNISTSRVGLSPYTGLVSPAYIRFTPKTVGHYNKFVYYYLMSLYHNCVYNNLGGDGVRSALNASDMGEFVIPYPSEEEQKTIAKFLDENLAKVDTLIANVQAQIEKLKAYKQSLITEVVTKGLDPTVPMKDSGVEWIGEIPEHWVMRKANTLSERIVVGVVIRPSEYFDVSGTVPFLRGMNVKDYQINTDDLVYISEESNQKLSKSIVHAGDILIVRDGNIGASCIVPPELDGSNVVSMILFTANSECTASYICYCLNSRVGKNQFELTKIGSALTHTSVSAVSRLVFPLPPISEQNRITAYLDERCRNIDRLIAIKQAKIEKLEQYKRSLIYEYVTGKKEV